MTRVDGLLGFLAGLGNNPQLDEKIKDMSKEFYTKLQEAYTQAPVQTVQDDAHLPITISIDVDSLLKSELGWQTFNAGSYEDPEPDYAPGGNGRIVDVVADKLSSRIQKDVTKTVQKLVKDRALTRVDDLIEEVMNGEIKLTNSYGETKETTTLREAMIKAMTDRMNSTVDRDGRSGGGYGKNTTYLLWLAQKAAEDVLDKNFMKKISEMSKEIRAVAEKTVAGKIAEVLGRGF